MSEEGRAHSRHSASGSYRWMACPGSVRATEGLGEEGSVYAREGTAAHALADRCLREGLDADAFIGGVACSGTSTVFTEAEVEADNRRLGRERGSRAWMLEDHDFGVDAGMAEVVQVYLDEVRSVHAALEHSVLRTERRLSLEWLRPGMFGTNDASVVQPFGRLVVVDYKHGKGVPVDVEDNAQLMYYALGVAHEEGWDFDAVDLVVVQPRCPHSDGPVRRWTTDVAALRAFADRLAAAYDRTLEPDAPLVAGDHCQFCPVAGTCPRLFEDATQSAMVDFSAEGTPEAQEVSLVQFADEQQLAMALRAVPMVDAWCKAVNAEALSRLSAGRPVPGFKLVRGKSNRKWQPEPSGVESDLLRASNEHGLGLAPADLYERPKLKGPAGVEKLKVPRGKKGLLRDAVAALVHRPPGRLAVAPEHDPREAVDPTLAAQEDFEAIDDGGETDEST